MREIAMICRIYDVTGATLEQYDQVSALEIEKPDGVHVHIAGKTDGGIMVIEVWDSEEHIDRYMESFLGQALQDAGVPEPTVSQFEVHNLDWMD